MAVRHGRGEAQAWACMFACGYDFFGDASAWTGLREPVHVRPPEARAEAERAWCAAVSDAWRRVGRIYIDMDMGADFGDGTADSWALQEFGEPEKCR